jgi:hypothetical protein
MRRALHNAILRNAALLVPASERVEWLAEWRAELCYVDHDATAFCFGSFRDAMWLRRNSGWSIREILDLDSPLRCVLLLTAAAVLTSLWAFGLPSRESLVEACSLSGMKQLALGCLGLYLESLLILVSLNPLELGEYPANQYAPSMVVRLRRWIFLNVKIILLASIFLFASIALLPIFPPALWILSFAWIAGLRWALADQKQRCPVCLHLLSNPTRIGSPTLSILAWYGTELICTRGHGMLYVPGVPTTWCSKQRWQYLDPTWSTLHS